MTITIADLRAIAARTAGNPWVRGVATTAGTRAAVLMLGLGSTVALARGLGPTGRGVYALAMTVATLAVVVFNLGFHSANTYFASREPETLPTLVSNTFAKAGAVGALGAVLLLVSRTFGIEAKPLSFGLMILIVAWVPVGLVFIQLQPLLLVLGKLRLYNIAEGGWQIASVALVVGLWVTGHLTPASAFLVTLAAFVAGATAVAVSVTSASPGLAPPSMRLFQRVLPYAGRSYAVTVTGIALVRLDIFLVENRLGTREVGLYAVAATICEAIQVLPGTIGALLLPKISALTDGHRQWAITRRVAVVTTGLMLLVCGAVALLAEVGVRVLYGEAFLPSTTPLYWLLPGIVLLGANTVLIHYFLAIGMPRTIVIAQALAVVLNLGLAAVLLGPLGLAGAGLASSIAYGAMFGATLSYAVISRRRNLRETVPS